MINKKIETFLEKNNMNYLFCLLSNLEVQRINTLPSYVKQKFNTKVTEMAMEHVADNEVPDYIIEIAEAELAMVQQSSPIDDEDNDLILDNETFDDSVKFIEEIQEEQQVFSDDDDYFDAVDDDDDDDL
ncbi:MAG: hypothetical protein U1C33_07065 [Candidatus Cloacimonadaceae bacterium]|nr:hypothetical protein [Candidatus Cloacimonadaceae bacterium]